MFLVSQISESSLEAVGAFLILVICLIIIGLLIVTVNSGSQGFRVCPRCGFPDTEDSGDNEPGDKPQTEKDK